MVMAQSFSRRLAMRDVMWRGERMTARAARDVVAGNCLVAGGRAGLVLGMVGGGPFFRQSIRSVWRSLQKPGTRYQPLSSRFQ